MKPRSQQHTGRAAGLVEDHHDRAIGPGDEVAKLVGVGEFEELPVR
jgi:hypothetical protein